MLAGYLALKVPEVIYHRIWDQVHFKKIKVLRNEVLTVPLIFDKKHWPWSNIELTVFAMTEEKILGSDSRHRLSCIYYLIYDFEKWGGINISTYVKENNILSHLNNLLTFLLTKNVFKKFVSRLSLSIYIGRKSWVQICQVLTCETCVPIKVMKSPCNACKKVLKASIECHFCEVTGL